MAAEMIAARTIHTQSIKISSFFQFSSIRESKVLRERRKPYRKILHGLLFFRAPWVHLFAGRFAHLHAPEETPSRHHTQINGNAKALTILLLCRYQTEG
jgi:hypothetical protein